MDQAAEESDAETEEHDPVECDRVPVDAFPEEPVSGVGRIGEQAEGEHQIDVFLAEHGEGAEDKKDVLQRQVTKKDALDDYSIMEEHETGACNLFSIHFKALFWKRFLVSFRNWKTLISEMLVVVVLCIFGFGVAKIQFFFDSPYRTLSPSLFPQTQRILYNSVAAGGATGTTAASVIGQLGTTYFTPSAQA